MKFLVSTSISIILFLKSPIGPCLDFETGEVRLGQGNVVVYWNSLILGVPEDEDNNVLNIGLICRMMAHCRLMVEC